MKYDFLDYAIMLFLLILSLWLLARPTESEAALPKIAPECQITTAELRHSAPLTAFKHQTGFPHGRPGYVIDHRCALACGGLDEPSNFQWQTIAEAKAKDKIERTPLGYRLFCNPELTGP